MIQTTVSCLVSDFLYYDRKDDEDLPRGSIEDAVKNGEITIVDPFAQCSDPIDRLPTVEDFDSRLANHSETLVHVWVPNVGRPREMSYDRSTQPGIYHAGAPANDLCWFRYEFKSEIAKLHMLYDVVDIRWGVVVDLV